MTAHPRSSLTLGRYTARFATTKSELLALQHLRHRAFTGRDGVDADAFDAQCDHLMVADTQTGQLVCGCRLMSLSSGRDINTSYSAQRYDLSSLLDFSDAMIEMGRFCVADGFGDVDVLRVAWAAITRMVQDRNVGMVFGCSSFAGTDPAPYQASFDWLMTHHQGPAALKILRSHPNTIAFAPIAGALCKKTALTAMPALLRSYLRMGGWVSDHAVVDADLNTLHVFTALEIAKVPASRAAALRALTASSG
jgi:putative hemolysin